MAVDLKSLRNDIANLFVLFSENMERHIVYCDAKAGADARKLSKELEKLMKEYRKAGKK